LNKNINTPDGQRLNKVFEWTRKRSYTAFAKELGFKRAQILYNVLYGKNGMSKNVADRIVEKYPQINIIWMRTGGGGMLKNAEAIPYEENVLQESVFDAEAESTYRRECPYCKEKDRTIALLTKQLENCIEAQDKSKQSFA